MERNEQQSKIIRDNQHKLEKHKFLWNILLSDLFTK